ncbi:MAG: MerR family transcriptional regulator [Microbacteriaceae bacterium]|nr:MAG: MerR family transcriptional regulator [Microbacteriaceae bacterium]
MGTDGAPDWSIQEIARLAGTTSRTLRHYGDVGLLSPSRIGSNGYRYYDRSALVRLQRILLLRDLGLGLPAVAGVLANETDTPHALRGHLEWLRAEQGRLARQIASVEVTIADLEGPPDGRHDGKHDGKGGERPMAHDMLDGFDHTQYRDEVEQRWGADAYAKSDAWWRSKTDAEKKRFQQAHVDIARDYATARAAGRDVASEEVQAIVRRHVDWLNLSAPVTGGPITRQRLLGYGDMYVSDPRFAANYGGIEGAEYVRAAIAVYAAALVE